MHAISHIGASHSNYTLSTSTTCAIRLTTLAAPHANDSGYTPRTYVLPRANVAHAHRMGPNIHHLSMHKRAVRGRYRTRQLSYMHGLHQCAKNPGGVFHIGLVVDYRHIKVFPQLVNKVKM